MNVGAIDTAQTTSTAEPIGHDVPCVTCRYNLRGLTTPGFCPECGGDLEPSVRAYVARMSRHKPLPPPDPHWVKRVRAGAGLLLVVLGLMLLPVFMPAVWFRLPYRNAPIESTPGRIALLSAACVWWTLAWAASWRLATRERIPDRPRLDLIARGLRWCSTAYLLTPFAWAWGTWSTEYMYGTAVWLTLLLCFGGVLSGWLSLWRMGQIFRRIGHDGSALACGVLAFAAAIIGLVMSGAADSRDPSSLTLMTTLPAYPFGSSYVFQLIVWRFHPVVTREPATLLLIIPLVLTPIAVVRLMVCQVRHVGRSVASFPP